MKKRKVPMRQCIACREKKVKQDLFRIVRTPDGEIIADLNSKGKTPGRGAYLCKNITCFEQAKKKKVLDRALETKISEDVYEQIKEGLTKVIDE